MLLGLLLGLTGVAILVGQNSLTIDSQAITAIVAALCASLSYAIASHYTKHAPKLSAFDNAHGSMWGKYHGTPAYFYYSCQRNTK